MTTAKMVYLVCEGQPDGLDVQVLNLVVAQKLRCDVNVEAAGGDRSLGSVRDYLAKRHRTRRILSIEDRNFHPMTDAELTWDNPGSKGLMWRRHEIENYLLDPRLVADAFRALREDGVRGSEGLPTTPLVIDQLLQQLAAPLLEEHAGWLAFWSLDTLRLSHYSTRLERPSGGLTERADWLDYLRHECARVRAVAVELARAPEFDADAVEELYDRFLTDCRRPDFLSTGQFLLDCEGKELMSGLCRHVSQLGMSHLSYSDLQGELLRAVDRLYSPGFYDPDDFELLAQRLSTL